MRGRQRHPATHLSIQCDLEGVLPGAGQGNIEHQHGSGFHVHHTGRWLAELYGSLAAEQLGAGLVHEANPDAVDADLGAPSPNPKHQVSAGANCGEIGQPHMLEDSQHAQLSLLINEGVVGDESEIEVQLS